MERQRIPNSRPLALALDIYSDSAIEPPSRNWWSRYNPTADDLPHFLERVRIVLMELTRQAAPGGR
jgi:hypothetical protein